MRERNSNVIVTKTIDTLLRLIRSAYQFTQTRWLIVCALDFGKLPPLSMTVVVVVGVLVTLHPFDNHLLYKWNRLVLLIFGANYIDEYRESETELEK